MKRDYMALWGILAVAFVIFLSLSFCSDIQLGDLRIRTPKFTDIFDNKPLADNDSLSVSDSIDNADTQIRLEAKPRCVLMIGDSMIEGLAPRLASYCKASGDSLYAVIWYSSTTEQYGDAHLITSYINRLHPDFIFISLGGNELFVKDVAQKRKDHVRSIVSELGSIPYLWIGPPNWKPDTGINSLISSSVPEGCFFLSDGMQFERKRDGAHPTAASSALWMDSIARWIPDHARYLLPLNEPEVPTTRPLRYFLHQPGALTQMQ